MIDLFNKSKNKVAVVSVEKREPFYLNKKQKVILFSSFSLVGDLFFLDTIQVRGLFSLAVCEHKKSYIKAWIFFEISNFCAFTHRNVLIKNLVELIMHESSTGMTEAPFSNKKNDTEITVKEQYGQFFI